MDSVFSFGGQTSTHKNITFQDAAAAGNVTLTNSVADYWDTGAGVSVTNVVTPSTWQAGRSGGAPTLTPAATPITTPTFTTAA